MRWLEVAQNRSMVVNRRRKSRKRKFKGGRGKGWKRKEGGPRETAGLGRGKGNKRKLLD